MAVSRPLPHGRRRHIALAREVKELHDLVADRGEGLVAGQPGGGHSLADDSAHKRRDPNFTGLYKAAGVRSAASAIAGVGVRDRSPKAREAHLAAVNTLTVPEFRKRGLHSAAVGLHVIANVIAAARIAGLDPRKVVDVFAGLPWQRDAL
ncbi:hypothetical protein [Streptomyces sp. NPDC060205]|uniref:hypothetical protein n=1 Tax=Streptomyces sp. NPDC060205 TaxID=3347072 RepID=UPI0036485AD2